jgi:energy-coupling factor transport system permease protein
VKNKFLQASSASPVSWWLLAISMAVAAGLWPTWQIQLGISGLALILILLFREDAPWSKSVGFYFFLAGFVVLARVGFRIIFNIENPADQTLLSLPKLSIDLGFGPTLTMFGEVGAKAIVSGLTDGLRLAAIILSVAMAASLANPRRLLKSTPGALYEIASSVSVAINLAPQLIASLQRVRKARSLRGRSKGVGAMAGTVIPVLEDAIESSLALAASMDSRGFGRRGELSSHSIRFARISSLGSILFLIIGSFLLLVGQWDGLGLAFIVIGLVFTFLAVRQSSKGSVRTRFRPERISQLDIAVILVSLMILLSPFLGRL